ncbi:Hermansky-Pudlak syndrome 6 protein-like [Polyodon spathula]|uniref:Hermansky-Pudlak syndrome 6 protein-like n=1 Tax=Polyodon spathula TaxID=7913 RepID=UPI001B7D91F7|nr:Hermansky-Pudlak syndrome 6 protein-like [Polyodon spathula]
MKGFALEQITDFTDFTRGGDLTEFLKQTDNVFNMNNCRSHPVRVSPDAQHIHAILQKPKRGLVTFDRIQRVAVAQSPSYLDTGSALSVPIVELLYLDSGSKDSSALVAVILENGKAEFWKYWERKAGWDLLQTSDLCNSSRAKVVSVCSSGKFIIWCEERAASESVSAFPAARNNFRYCICKRTYEREERGVRLGGVKITLHNSPCYRVLAARGDVVYLLPDNQEAAAGNGSKFFLTWSPKQDRMTISSVCKGALLSKTLHSTKKDSDYKTMISECVGMLATISPPEICSVAPTSCGGLLLLLSSGCISLLQSDGVLRQIYTLALSCPLDCSNQISMQIYGSTLACIVYRTLYLVDTSTGRLLENITLKTDGMLFLNSREKNGIHFLSSTGMYLVKELGVDPTSKQLGCSDTARPDAALVEAVFEEACRYYQRRSLSSTQLTVEKLKSGGMFQAPIALSSILGVYMKTKKDSELPQGGGGYSKLLASLGTELESLVALEQLKASVVSASDRKLSISCETLVGQEVNRLLFSDLDRDNLLYLNVIFKTFPREFWQALQASLRLGSNGEGFLTAKAAPEVWKTVLSPVQSAPAPLSSSQQQTPSNGAVPVFELICHSLFTFQPKWLSRFVELAQQQAGASSWNHGGKESPESVPLYKRALRVLPREGQAQELQVELLLCSQRPNAVMQAMRILLELRHWERVAEVAQRFSQQSPLLNKEIFTTLLCEVSQHRDLDPYLDLLWTLCPEDMTVTSILNIVLKSLPPCGSEHKPFRTDRNQMTIGMLKPLLNKVLQRETKPSQRYADILQSPSFPPPTPPRQPHTVPRSVTEPAMPTVSAPSISSSVNNTSVDKGCSSPRHENK